MINHETSSEEQSISARIAQKQLGKNEKIDLIAKLSFTPQDRSFISKTVTQNNDKSVSDLVKQFMKPSPVISPQKSVNNEEFKRILEE